jgi:arginine:ornithine antiporter/lysine permease
LVQLVLITTLFSDDAFTFTLTLCTSLSLVPYLLAAAYSAKLAQRGETYEREPRPRRKDLLVAALATVYTAFLVYAAGLVFLLLGLLVYALGTVLFVKARRERDRRVFAPAELVLLVVVVVGAVGAVVGLATGLISI